MQVKARSFYEPFEGEGVDFTSDKGVTKQADAKDCDINNILKRYEKTGTLPDMIEREPRYGDFSDAPTFQEAFDIVTKAKEQFAALDANIRNRFENDPAQFLAFVTDPKNLKEVVKMGLGNDTAKARLAAEEDAAAAELAKKDASKPVV